jgi:hypothetical protein
MKVSLKRFSRNIEKGGRAKATSTRQSKKIAEARGSAKELVRSPWVMEVKVRSAIIGGKNGAGRTEAADLKAAYNVFSLAHGEISELDGGDDGGVDAIHERLSNNWRSVLASFPKLKGKLGDVFKEWDDGLSDSEDKYSYGLVLRAICDSMEKKISRVDAGAFGSEI